MTHSMSIKLLTFLEINWEIVDLPIFVLCPSFSDSDSVSPNEAICGLQYVHPGIFSFVIG